MSPDTPVSEPGYWAGDGPPEQIAEPLSDGLRDLLKRVVNAEQLPQTYTVLPTDRNEPGVRKNADGTAYEEHYYKVVIGQTEVDFARAALAAIPATPDVGLQALAHQIAQEWTGELDVERLAEALKPAYVEGLLEPTAMWTLTEVAESIAAEYARLAQEPPRSETDQETV